MEQSYKNTILLSIFAVLLLIITAMLQYRLFSPNGSFSTINDLNLQITMQGNENTRLEERNNALRLDIYELKHSNVLIEEKARFDLGLIKPFETLYIFP